MTKNVRFMLFTLLVVVIGAGLCFGQAAPTRVKPQVQPQAAAPAAAPTTAPAAAPNALATDVRFRKDLVVFTQNDGLQCLLSNAAALNAAYAEAAQTGCKKVKVGQATLYNCGFHPSAYYGKCLEAKAKIDAIFQKCGITAPVNQGGMMGVTPGCNSRGIFCLEDPA